MLEIRREFLSTIRATTFSGNAKHIPFSGAITRGTAIHCAPVATATKWLHSPKSDDITSHITNRLRPLIRNTTMAKQTKNSLRKCVIRELGAMVRQYIRRFRKTHPNNWGVILAERCYSKLHDLAINEAIIFVADEIAVDFEEDAIA